MKGSFPCNLLLCAPQSELLGLGGLGRPFSGHADGLVDDGVEELVVVSFGLGFDIGFRRGGPAAISKKLASFVLAADDPGLVDGGGDDLVGGPVVRGGRLGGRS